MDLIQHARLPCPSLSPGVDSNSCPLSWWCHPTISPSVVPFSSCPQSFPASGSFPLNWVLTSSGQSIGASASVLPMNSQDWFSLALTTLISLLSKGFSRVFSSTTVWKHQCPLHWKYSLNHWTISEVEGALILLDAASCGGIQYCTYLLHIFLFDLVMSCTSSWSCFGEGNGNQLQYSCLEHSMDRGAW